MHLRRKYVCFKIFVQALHEAYEVFAMDIFLSTVLYKQVNNAGFKKMTTN
jgi:hypothetical protein